MAKLINIGFGNVVNSRKIVAVVSPDAAPVKRMIQSIKGTRSLIDATQGRKTKAVIVTSDDYLVLSALQPETLPGVLRKLIIMKKRKRNMSKGVLTVVSGFSGAGKRYSNETVFWKNMKIMLLSISVNNAEAS